MTHTCGTCSMCCKLMAVEELNKPVNVWCQHVVKRKGCGIYSDRPESCRTFQCLWLRMKDMPEEARPDRCKVMLDAAEQDDGTPALVAMIDPAYPLAWNEGVIGKIIHKWATITRVIISSGVNTNKIILRADEFGRPTMQTIEFTPVDEHGKQQGHG